MPQTDTTPHADLISLETARSAMSEIVAHFEPTLNGNGSGRGKMKFYDLLAAKLNAAAGNNPGWSGKYIQSAISGTMIRTPLRKAILVLAASLDGLPVEFARAEKVEVYAEPGTVRPGSYIFGKSRACAVTGCPAVITSDNSLRKYCPAHNTPAKRKMKKGE